jgi:ABC-2 type transport system permease protein
MRFSNSWIVTAKDLSVFRNNKYILYSLIAMPIIIGLLIPVMLIYTLQAQAALLTQAQLVESATYLVDTFSSFFVLTAVALPTLIASYSFIGEKLEKSLEPLLATPTTDGELLFGKSLGAFIPCIGATYIGELIFVIVLDSWSMINLGTFLLPTMYWALVTGMVIPLAGVLSVEANIIISSRMNDLRAAQQVGSIIIMPLLLLTVLPSLIPTIPMVTIALILSGGLAIADIGLFYLSKATFQREEILTKWK